VASAGPYANLHLAQRDNHASIPALNFFTDWMPFLPPNQQRQSTEGMKRTDICCSKISFSFLSFDYCILQSDRHY